MKTLTLELKQRFQGLLFMRGGTTEVASGVGVGGRGSILSVLLLSAWRWGEEQRLVYVDTRFLLLTS